MSKGSKPRPLSITRAEAAFPPGKASGKTLGGRGPDVMGGGTCCCSLDSGFTYDTNCENVYGEPDNEDTSTERVADMEYQTLLDVEYDDKE